MWVVERHKRLFLVGFLLLLTLAACSLLEAEPTVLSPADGQPLDSSLGSIGDPFAPELGNLGYDVIQYTIQARFDPAMRYYLEASVTIEALSTLDGLNQVWLDFIGFEIDEVSVDGAPAEYLRPEDKLVVWLPEPLAAGQSFALTVSYLGTPLQEPSRYVPFEDHSGLFFIGDESLYALSEPDGSRFWFPCNDHPRDKAAFRFEITVPNGYTAVANGLLLDTQSQEGGDQLFIWEHDYPMATYLATVAVGEYYRVEATSPAGVPLRHYGMPIYEGVFEDQVAITGEALDWMSEKFGAYPFEAFGYVLIEGGGHASLETQTMVLLDALMLDEKVIVHELIHMWFGDWVSLDSWGEMWRNEGFAVYMELVWETRDNPGQLANEMANLRQYLSDYGPTEPLDDLSPGNLFGIESYIKGALVVHALRQEVGNQAFYDGLRAYFQRYGGGTASDDDFQAVMEEVVGRSLEAFFQAQFSN